MRCTWASAPTRWASCPTTAWTTAWLQLAAALAVGALVALGVGAICLRTSGMAFIMITLAFAQMLYFLAVSLREYGGPHRPTAAKRKGQNKCHYHAKD